jgi:hypothetical protein
MQVQLSSGRVADSAKNRLASTENIIIITFPAHFKKCDENGCTDGSYCSDNEVSPNSILGNLPENFNDTWLPADCNRVCLSLFSAAPLLYT